MSLGAACGRVQGREIVPRRRNGKRNRTPASLAHRDGQTAGEVLWISPFASRSDAQEEILRHARSPLLAKSESTKLLRPAVRRELGSEFRPNWDLQARKAESPREGSARLRLSHCPCRPTANPQFGPQNQAARTPAENYIQSATATISPTVTNVLAIRNQLIVLVESTV